MEDYRKRPNSKRRSGFGRSSNGTTTRIIPTTAMIMTEVHRKRPVMEIATNSRTDEKKKSQYRQLKIK
ncbi:hypothetical protein KY289_009046 [Solanum tuberosum]|nr:hypothetical protein KY289_009046 [Solanum tuberosum]KAH0715693.1 hypothetical protein KY284_008598 [Solanum tuberosum]